MCSQDSMISLMVPSFWKRRVSLFISHLSQLLTADLSPQFSLYLKFPWPLHELICFFSGSEWKRSNLHVFLASFSETNLIYRNVWQRVGGNNGHTRKNKSKEVMRPVEVVRHLPITLWPISVRPGRVVGNTSWNSLWVSEISGSHSKTSSRNLCCLPKTAAHSSSTSPNLA